MDMKDMENAKLIIQQFTQQKNMIASHVDNYVQSADDDGTIEGVRRLASQLKTMDLTTEELRSLAVTYARCFASVERRLRDLTNHWDTLDGFMKGFLKDYGEEE